MDRPILEREMTIFFFNIFTFKIQFEKKKPTGQNWRYFYVKHIICSTKTVDIKS